MSTHGCIDKTHHATLESVLRLPNTRGFMAVAKDHNPIRLEARKCSNSGLILSDAGIIQKDGPGLARLRLNVSR